MRTISKQCTNNVQGATVATAAKRGQHSGHSNQGEASMLNYQQLDLIADSYTPLLAAIWLSSALWPLRQRRWPTAARNLASGLVAAAIVYGLMFVDLWLALWPRWALDYSTHSALAIALVVQLWWLLPRQRWLWLTSLLAYAGLMRYQGYHSWGDMVTTCLVVAPLLLIYRPTTRAGETMH